VSQIGEVSRKINGGLDPGSGSATKNLSSQKSQKSSGSRGYGSTTLGYENNHVLLLTIEEARHYDGVKVAAAEEPGQSGVRHTRSGQHNAFQPTRR
jgi:hypothetical protein